jgi:hypothetical protein
MIQSTSSPIARAASKQMLECHLAVIALLVDE